MALLSSSQASPPSCSCCSTSTKAPEGGSRGWRPKKSAMFQEPFCKRQAFKASQESLQSEWQCHAGLPAWLPLQDSKPIP
eukprot:scaffold5532_cov263-Pinguiococcus_pyrenoidosus.AAC.11